MPTHKYRIMIMIKSMDLKALCTTFVALLKENDVREIRWENSVG